MPTQLTKAAAAVPDPKARFVHATNNYKDKVPSLCCCCIVNFCVAVGGLLLLFLTSMPTQDFSSYERAQCTLESVLPLTTETMWDPIDVLDTEKQQIATSWGLGVVAIVNVVTETNRNYTAAGNDCGVFTYVDRCNCTNRNNTICYDTRSANINWKDCPADPWCDIRAAVPGPCVEGNITSADTTTAATTATTTATPTPPPDTTNLLCHAPQLDHGAPTGATMAACSNHQHQVDQLPRSKWKRPTFECWAAPFNAVPPWYGRISVVDHRKLYKLRGQWVGVRFVPPDQDCALAFQDNEVYYGMALVGGILCPCLCCTMLFLLGICRVPKRCTRCCTCCTNTTAHHHSVHGSKVQHCRLDRPCKSRPVWKQKLDAIRGSYVVEKEKMMHHYNIKEAQQHARYLKEATSQTNAARVQHRKIRLQHSSQTVGQQQRLATSLSIVDSLQDKETRMQGDFEESLALVDTLTLACDAIHALQVNVPVCALDEMADILQALHYKLSIGNLNRAERNQVIEQILHVERAPLEHQLLSKHNQDIVDAEAAVAQEYSRKMRILKAMGELRSARDNYQTSAELEKLYNNGTAITPGMLHVKRMSVVDIPIPNMDLPLPKTTVLNQMLARLDVPRFCAVHCVVFETMVKEDTVRIQLTGLSGTVERAVGEVTKLREVVVREMTRGANEEWERERIALQEQMMDTVTLASYYDHRRPPLE